MFFVCFLSFEGVVVVVAAAKVARVRDARRDREPASVFFLQRRLCRRATRASARRRRDRAVRADQRERRGRRGRTTVRRRIIRNARERLVVVGEDDDARLADEKRVVVATDDRLMVAFFLPTTSLRFLSRPLLRARAPP
jgi:hypothetical protein